MGNMFGSGRLWAIPTSDYLGNTITVPTPVQFGSLQDISVDFGFDVKKLYGTRQFADAIARGKGTIQGKASLGKINGGLLNTLFFGQPMSSSILNGYNDITGAVVPGTPFTITPTPPGSGVWSEDLGVTNAAGLTLTRVASGPTTGQYSVTAGAYLFAAADTGITMYINYQYTGTSTTASTATLTNPAMGSTPTFQAEILFPGSAGGIYTGFTLLNCTSTKLAVASKLDEFGIQNLSFEASANTAGQIIKMSTSN